MAPSPTEIEQVLDEGRAEMTGLFTDTCRITRAASHVPGEARGELNEETGEYDDRPTRVVVYEGPSRIQVKADINSNVVETTAGDREWVYLTTQIQLPAGEDDRIVTGSPYDVDVDDVCVVLTAPYAPALEGVEIGIAGPYHKSHAVYLRFRGKEPVG